MHLGKVGHSHFSAFFQYSRTKWGTKWFLYLHVLFCCIQSLSHLFLERLWMTSTWKLSWTTFHNDCEGHEHPCNLCAYISVRQVLSHLWSLKKKRRKKCLNELIRFLLLCTNWSLSRRTRRHTVCVLQEAWGKVCLLLARMPSSGISPVCTMLCWITWQSLLYLTMQINFIPPDRKSVV